VLFRIKSDEIGVVEESDLQLEEKLAALKLVNTNYKRKKRQVLFALPVVFL